MQDKEELDQENEGSFFDEVNEDDFAFVVGANGELKSVLVPSVADDVPDNVVKILEIFGINSIGGQRTLH